jgi:hypothetical protein
VDALLERHSPQFAVGAKPGIDAIRW